MAQKMRNRPRELTPFQRGTYDAHPGARKAIERRDPRPALAAIRARLEELVEERRETVNPEGTTPELKMEFSQNVSVSGNPQLRLVMSGDQQAAKEMSNYLNRKRSALRRALAEAGWKTHTVSLRNYPNSVAVRIKAKKPRSNQPTVASDTAYH